MSGHSKWSTIKHKKAKEDAKRGKVFTKIVREITVAAREGGGDPAGNAKLRLLVDKARHANMPQDNILRAIKKGTGELAGEAYESALYEGYGPCGIAVLVETLSDNKNRTVSDLRHLFLKMGGTLGDAGSVHWMFEHKGVITLAVKNVDEDDLLQKCIDEPIEDIKTIEDTTSVMCSVSDLIPVKEALVKSGYGIEAAELAWVPKNAINVEDGEAEQKIYKFLEAIEDLDDVQNVYTNLV
jgi:YebC/PmpR family DNA-binding regulatory protein